MIDRIATRFGAFAIVATIAYPVWQAADALLRARRHDLPDLAGQGFVVWSSIMLGTVLLLFAGVLGFSVFVPVARVFERMTSAARWFVVLPLGLAMGVCFVAYALLMVAVFTSDQLKPIYGDLAQSLRHVQVCDDQRLHGRVCQDVLYACAEKGGDGGACRDIARRHIDRIRPVVGAFR
ncbi:hypothetical protein [Paracoccus sp. 22332]|uniref:hypothetical protein n=1 Tax=Paracoccus sp. 22332 TaxID=3453913 RepID=UPI003F83C44F